MTIFISYARKDRAAAETLRRDLERALSSVWLDDELMGGQAWWETILAQIRSCQLFVFVLSPESLRSKACQAELRYAVAVQRPLLPVTVKPVSVQLVPRVISDTQIIDYTERTPDGAVALVTAVATHPPAPPLPQPLPPPPLAPLSYMNPYRQQIQGGDLSFRDQAQLVRALRGHLQDDDEGDAARQLLTELRGRRDVAEIIARDIDGLLADPSGRHEQRYWDGTRWTEHVVSAGRQAVDDLNRPEAGEPSGSATAAAFTGGTYLGLIIMTLLFGIVGVIIGALNLKHPARRGQAHVLLWLGIAVLIVGFAVVGSGNA